MKRRTFLKTSGIFGGGVILGQKDLQIMFNEQRIRLGIIGYGARGSGIKSILIKMPDFFELKTVCDILDFRLEKVFKEKGMHNVKAVKN